MEYIIDLPEIVDRENLEVEVKTYEKSKGKLPLGIIYEQMKYKITKEARKGVYEIIINLQDKLGAESKY